MIYTKNETLQTELDLWAIPKGKYELEEEVVAGNPAPTPFRYALYNTDSKPWLRGSVKITRQPHTFTVPGGINLYEMALETLEESKADVYKEAARQAKQIDEEINQLKLLSGPAATPVEDDEDGLIIDQ